MTRVPDPGDGKGERHARRRGMPRWVKVFGAIGLVLLVLFIALHLTGHGFAGHSPH